MGNSDEMKNWQFKIHEVIFGYDSVAGKAFDIGLLIVILASVIQVMLESVAEIHNDYGHIMAVFEWIFTILFSVEYLARILSSPKPAKYIFSFMGMVDLLSLIPTYLGIFTDGTGALSVIRSIRLIRVFRILKLTHFMGGANQLGNAVWNSRHKIIVFLGTVLCVTVIMGTLMYLVEGPENGFTSIPRGIYWAIVTITTVGYGDIAPATILGQTVASFLMIMGYGVIAVPTGIVTNEMIKTDRNSALITKNCSSCNETLIPERANFCPNCGVGFEGELFV